MEVLKKFRGPLQIRDGRKSEARVFFRPKQQDNLCVMLKLMMQLSLLIPSFSALLLLLATTADAEDVFASAAEIQLLDKGELELADSLSRYLDNEYWRLQQLQQSVNFHLFIRPT